MIWWIDTEHRVWSWLPGAEPVLEHPDIQELLGKKESQQRPMPDLTQNNS